ncbi:MAG: ANTAR domain-containing protein [Firmicutes bacterium]|nr:ANTAR domain-containing protein [Bacillota bacterium]
MEKVLVVSSNKTFSESLLAFLREYFSYELRFEESAYQALNVLESDTGIDLVVVNSPLMDETGIELAEKIAENFTANCILLIKAEAAEKLSERMEKAGVIPVGKPFSKTVLYQIIRTVDIAAMRAMSLYLKNKKLEEKLSDIKTIDKAKFMLMEYKSMTEEQAHQYLEKYAMNKRKKKNIAALDIIDKLSEQYL